MDTPSVDVLLSVSYCRSGRGTHISGGPIPNLVVNRMIPTAVFYKRLCRGKVSIVTNRFPTVTRRSTDDYITVNAFLKMECSSSSAFFERRSFRTGKLAF